ncbi:hypothetical protein [Microbacterium sp. YJN-G]|uniref:hypothetical protein n=1 Tax=Microbacterium sp. YJN-G TaxID=2763257 RepID=UPI001877E2F9|nr:hypothetical protein [Microbacterium sp. YJN-G]
MTTERVNVPEVGADAQTRRGRWAQLIDETHPNALSRLDRLDGAGSRQIGDAS